MMEGPGRAVGLQRLSSSSGVSSISVSHGMSSVRSMSVASISSEGSSESHSVEQEEISALTHDVRAFKEALGHLRRIFQHSERDLQDNVRTMAHDRLGEVLRILRVVLEKHHTLQNTELLMAAGALIQQVKGHDYEDDKASTKEFFDSIDKLALAFSSRVSEYLMGDLDVVNLPFTNAVTSKTKSYETLTCKAASVRGRSAGMDEPSLPGEQESELLKIEHSVEALLRRAKLCSKYLKDVVMYVEKRALLDLEYAKNLSKLAMTVKPFICEESHFPLQGIFCHALDNDTDNCNAYLDTGALILGSKFLEPMRARRLEHERRRKQLKEQWQREMRRMQEAEGVKRKAYAIFAQRQQAAKAVVDLDTKPERRRKVDDDAIQKAFEAESTYKKACLDVETQARHLQKVKAEVLHSLQALLLQYDQTIKATTMNYFQLQHNQSSLTPIQFQRLYESSSHYEPGQQYHEFVKRFCALASQKHALQSSASMSQVMDAAGDPDVFIQGSGRGPFQVKQAWGSFKRGQQAESDSDSSHSGKSRESSPVLNSPPATRSSGDEIDQKEDEHVILPDDVSKASLSHKLKILNLDRSSHLRCSECDNKIYGDALQCVECGLNCHRGCLLKLNVFCGTPKLPENYGVFGTSLSQHLQESGCSIPPVITKCVEEIEKSALTIKGIYRVSGVKSKVEKLVEEFESGADKVDLSGVNCHVVASVLKLYLRQLPDPLLTFELYSSFVKLAKEWPTSEGSMSGSVSELGALVQQLPADNLNCLRFLVKHLCHVAAHSDANLMPSANLGIVFGPTLLRTPNGHTSLSCLMDTVHQTRAIELLVVHADVLFGVSKHPKDCIVLQELLQQKQGESQQVVDLPGYIPEQDALSSPEYEPGPSQDDILFGFASDDDIPDSLLPDFTNLDSYSPILRRNLHHSGSANIIKCSLRDYKGLEGVTSEKKSTANPEPPSSELVRLYKSKSAVDHRSGTSSDAKQAETKLFKGRKESIADSDDVDSHLSSSVESSSFRDEMLKRHQQHLLISGPGSSMEESQSETEDAANGGKSALPRKFKDSSDGARSVKTSSSSSSLIHSTKHHISVVTSHLVGRRSSRKDSGASTASVTISPPIVIPKKAEKVLGETIVHKITLVDENEKPSSSDNSKH
ncbi:rho GTPase-activating protein 45-like isoform X2 [Neocloeon triangulifer]|nr:rho GTPase-activating protein 45-like isoform X2 [Neocloeon triangulifer]XP_059468966.1 rho GTPase-activating protein 45-like isoform X2 [Neocloeon triangulifer]